MAIHGAYFDHAATSPLRPTAREAFVEASGIDGNPAALHRAGQRAKRRLEEAREEIAAGIGCHPTQVIFTSGGSEANSLAILGWIAAQTDNARVRVTAIEHPSVLQARTHGASTWPVRKDGRVDLDADLPDVPGLISAMLVNNETGIIQPMDEIREAAGSARVHCDAVQALGHVPVSFRELGVDALTIAGHKIGAPVGIGALIAQRDFPMKPVGLGGVQERAVRSGTQPVALAAALAAAVTAATQEVETEAQRLGALQAQVARIVEQAGGHVNTFDAPHAPHIVNVTFPTLRASDVLFLLDRAGVFASVGSACRAGVHQPSEVLRAMGRSDDDAAATLRFSLGWSTTEADVSLLAEQLPDAVARAQRAF